MSERLAIEREGAGAAREALERVLGAGGVAAFPADGLYGLACDPLRAEAVARIHALKGRPEGKPSAVMYLSPLAMREIIASVGPRTRELVGALLPGRLTLVVANPERRYPLACGSTPERLGLRLIEGPLAGVMAPLFQTSANRSGEPAPRSAAELDPGLADGVDLVIDGGELDGLPSTVVDLARIEDDGRWAVLREGAVPFAELEPALEPAGHRHR